MPNLRNRFPARRRFLKQSAALTASASLAAPMLVVAREPQPAPPPAEPAAPAGQPQAGAPTPDRRRLRTPR